jgi:2-dehydropantoate 2-reductase
MLQDLEAGRITEVDMLNGYVCAMGRKYGIATPYNDAVVSIVHRQEKGELPLSTENLQHFPN